MKGYFASHFFNEGMFEYSKKLVEQIREKFPEFNLYLPQENDDINDKEKNDANITAIKIAEADNVYLKESNILIANIDGVEIDAGVASEIGYFSGLIETEKLYEENPKKRVIIGLYTDMRQNGTGNNRSYVNLYTKGLIEKNGVLVSSRKELLEVLKNYIK